MNKKIRVLAVATALACLTAVPCVAFGAEAGTTEAATASAQQTKMAYRLKACLFSKSGVVINSDYEFDRIRMGHDSIGVSVVKSGDDRSKTQDVKNFDYKFTIDGVNYPKVVSLNEKGNYFVLNLPYGVAGKGKLEVVNKWDKSARGVLEFKIDNEEFYGIVVPEEYTRYPFNFENSDKLLSAAQQKLSFTYNKETGKYTFTLPGNPLKGSQKKFFEGWKVTEGDKAGKVYKPSAKVVVTKRCVIEPVTSGSAGHWGEKYNRWVFYDANGNLVKNTMRTINGNKYSFDEYGIMKTGWKYDNGTWYYFNKKGQGTEGAMVINKWKKIDGKWYYFHNDGKMASDEHIGKYYVNKSGAWSYDHWIKSNNGKWWYAYEKGGYAKDGIKTINGKQYCFDQKGWMVTGWKYDNGTWYYFNKKGQGTEGAMAMNQWKKIGYNWYYFYNDGKMAADTTIGKYYVNKSGAWTYAHWIKSSNGRWWYSYKDGTYPKGEIELIGENFYYFDDKGWMVTGWKKYNNIWHYFNKKGEGTEGAMVQNQWKKINGKWYHFNEIGYMHEDSVIDGYRVDKTGAWVR